MTFVFIIINNWYVSKNLERVEVSLACRFLPCQVKSQRMMRNLRFVEIYCLSISLLTSPLYAVRNVNNFDRYRYDIKI